MTDFTAASFGAADCPDSKHQNPMCRLVVDSSTVLPTRSVAVLDMHDTVAIGRDKQTTPHLRLKEMSVSKHHAYIFHDMTGGGWSVVDNGSVHGTFLVRELDFTSSETSSSPASRLSPSRAASLPRSLDNMDRLVIGGTTFIVHVHSDNEPCTDCDTELAPLVPLPAVNRNTSHSRATTAMPPDISNSKLALKKLKNDILSRYTHGTSTSKRKASDGVLQDSERQAYADRASQRRQATSHYGVVTQTEAIIKPASPISFNNSSTPTHTPAPMRPSSVAALSSLGSMPLSEENIGHRLLMKQGWRQGDVLGISQEAAFSALAEPLDVRILPYRAGVGSAPPPR